MVGHGLPSVVPECPVSLHLEVLDLLPCGDGAGILGFYVEGVGQAGPLDWLLGHASNLVGQC